MISAGELCVSSPLDLGDLVSSMSWKDCDEKRYYRDLGEALLEANDLNDLPCLNLDTESLHLHV
jgi:hypothetical protein